MIFGAQHFVGSPNTDKQRMYLLPSWYGSRDHDLVCYSRRIDGGRIKLADSIPLSTSLAKTLLTSDQVNTPHLLQTLTPLNVKTANPYITKRYQTGRHTFLTKRTLPEFLQCPTESSFVKEDKGVNSNVESQFSVKLRNHN